MYAAQITNASGDMISLTNDYMTCYKIDGLDPPKATVNFSEFATSDGAVFNSAKLPTRNIVIYLAIEKNPAQARLLLYHYAAPKSQVTFSYQNDIRDVYTVGYVESLEIGYYDKKETAQISILCGDPYFNDITPYSSVVSTTIGAFVFPFAIDADGIPFSYTTDDARARIYNPSEATYGCEITLVADGTVVNPTIYFATSGQVFSLTVTMSDGDEIRVNTLTGQKTVTMTHAGTTSNILNKMSLDSAWLQLVPGYNVVSVDADSGAENIEMSIAFSKKYVGV